MGSAKLELALSVRKDFSFPELDVEMFLVSRGPLMRHQDFDGNPALSPSPRPRSRVLGSKEDPNAVLSLLAFDTPEDTCVPS